MSNDTSFEARQKAIIGKALRDAGREDLAEAFEQGTEPKPAEPETPEPTEGQAFADELRAKQAESWSSTPGLLDR